MDYHDKTAGTARLAVIKYSATASKKLGTIFFNPGNSFDLSFTVFRSYPISIGGPGESGLEAISELGQTFSQGFQGAFDIVSWDPRGVGLTLWVNVMRPFQLTYLASSSALELLLALIPRRKMRRFGITLWSAIPTKPSLEGSTTETSRNSIRKSIRLNRSLQSSRKVV